eukprot:COSAG02_NODE_1406_length_12786_cov_5.493418_12_plen_148_part_00
MFCVGGSGRGRPPRTELARARVRRRRDRNHSDIRPNVIQRKPVSALCVLPLGRTISKSHCFGWRPPVSPNPPGQIVRENSAGFADRGGGAPPPRAGKVPSARARSVGILLASFIQRANGCSSSAQATPACITAVPVRHPPVARHVRE